MEGGPTGSRRFAGFEFDPATGELAGPEGSARLPPKAARLLALLLERPGELVSRERLRQELWPDQHVELDQALAYTVRQVRAALGDDGAEPRFLETLPRRGYRLIGEAVPAAARESVPEGRPAPRRRVLATAALVIALGLGLVAWGLRLRGSSHEVAAHPVRLALLPLGEPGLEAANDPLTEALVVALTAQPGLDVVGPATTAELRGTTRPHTELGRELGVAFVASGGYRPAEGFLFLQLVRVPDGAHVFAQRYSGAPGEVQEQIGQAASDLAAAAAANSARP